MYFFEYHKKSQEILQESHKKYDSLFESPLSDEGLEARYYLLEYLRGTFHYMGGLKKDGNGGPIPLTIKDKSYYWSISHSKNYIAYIVSEKPVGIDIAEREVRDIRLLDTHREREYAILGEKNWLNFYKLWTAKESIIKQSGGKLDDMTFITLTENKGNLLSRFEFDSEIYTIHTIIQDDIILSFSEIC